jgi:mutator protein MutT
LNRPEQRSLIHVVAAALIDDAGRVLIAQRPQGKHLEGGWEFPGGKLKSAEDRRAGLARELSEELGITIGAPRPLMRLRHTYPYGEVLLDMWVVRHYQGEPAGLDGQALRWCTRAELESVELLPADAPIVRALRLPERLMEASTPDYTVGDLGSCGKGPRRGFPGFKPGRLPRRNRGNLRVDTEARVRAGPIDRRGLEARSNRDQRSSALRFSSKNRLTIL